MVKNRTEVVDWSKEMEVIETSLEKFKYQLYMDYSVTAAFARTGLSITCKGIIVNGKLTKLRKVIVIDLWELRMLAHPELIRYYVEYMLRSELNHGMTIKRGGFEYDTTL